MTPEEIKLRYPPTTIISDWWFQVIPADTNKPSAAYRDEARAKQHLAIYHTQCGGRIKRILMTYEVPCPT